MAQRKINFFDKIGNLIRGYKGYSVREDKRNTDKKLRDELAQIIQQSENSIVKQQQQLLKIGEKKLVQEWEIARKVLNTLYSKIKNATYGESSFFTESQLKESELDEIYSFDLEVSERVNLIFETAVNEINETISAFLICQQVIGIETILSKRTAFINKYK